MDQYDWYKLFNRTEFEALGVPSRQYTMEFQDRGLKTFMATKGIGVSVLIDDVFLMADLNNKNPFVFDSMVISTDSENNIWVGYLREVS